MFKVPGGIDITSDLGTNNKVTPALFPARRIDVVLRPPFRPTSNFGARRNANHGNDAMRPGEFGDPTTVFMAVNDEFSARLFEHHSELIGVP